MKGSITRTVRLILVGAAVAAATGWPEAAVRAQTFQPAGHLVYPRDNSQSTLLPDGKVLLTGGYQYIANNGGPILFAELFDPATGQSTALPWMADFRDDSERAVLLKDGRVLICSGGGTRLVEIFDPATRQFELAGVMLLSIGGPTASLLPDGRVLIAGGYSSLGPTDPLPPVTTAAEIFDPMTGQAQPTGSMKTARYRHAAVTLPDGRIVVLGGVSLGGQLVSSVEIHDPSTGTFTTHGHLIQSRSDLRACLLPNGRILVVDGLNLITDAQGNVTGPRQSVEIYDPATGQSQITDTLPDARTGFAAASLADGSVLIAGGVDFTAGKALDTAFVADPVTGKLSPTAPMATPRAGATSVSLPDGRVLIIGGRNPSSLDTVEAYGPATAPGQTPP